MPRRASSTVPRPAPAPGVPSTTVPAVLPEGAPETGSPTESALLENDFLELTGENHWEPIRHFTPLPPELVSRFGVFPSGRSAPPPLPLSLPLPLAVPDPQSIFYGLAYTPARLCTPHSRQEIHALAGELHRQWKTLGGDTPPSPAAIATVLHGWRFVFEPVSRGLFPSAGFPDLPGATPSGVHSLYTAVRNCLRTDPPPKEALRHFVRLLQEDLQVVTEVPGGVLAPFRPTPFTRYCLLPPLSADWYYPVLFMSRSVEKLPSPQHPAHRPALMTGPDFVRLSPAIIVATAPPDTGERLLSRHTRQLQDMMAPFLGASVPERSRSHRTSQMTLFSAEAPPPRATRRKPKGDVSGVSALPELEITVQQLLAGPDRWSHELPLRNLAGQVLPPPRWVAERLMGVALQTGQTTWEDASLGLSAVMDPRLGIVSVNAGYMAHFSRPTSFHRHLWLPEPWAADVPAGPFHTLAQAVDLSVWEGRPELTRRLLALYAPSELRRQLPPTVWERWNLVSGWAACTLAERPVNASPLRYHRLRPHRRDADLLQILHEICPGMDREGTVYLHTCQAAAIAVELRRRGHSAAADVWTRRMLENNLRRQTWNHRAGILESAICLQDYLTRHAPQTRPTKETRPTKGMASPVDINGWSTHPSVLTPSCLHRLESFVLGTRHEAGYAQMLSGFLERLAAHSRDMLSVLTSVFDPSFSSSFTTNGRPSSRDRTLREPVSDAPVRHPVCDAVFPALDAFIWGGMAAEMLPEFLTHRIPSASPALFRDGFGAYLWKLHLLGSNPESVRHSLSYEAECIHRLKTLEYNSTFNTVLMAMGTLELIRQSHQVRQSWLTDLAEAHQSADMSRLSRLAMLSPVIPLRHPDWPRMWHNFCVSTLSDGVLSRSMSMEISRMMTAERSLGMVEPVVETGHLPFRSYYPHDWLPHHRPHTYRMGGCHLPTPSPSADLVAYRHYPLVTGQSSMG